MTGNILLTYNVSAIIIINQYTLDNELLSVVTNLNYLPDANNAKDCAS